MNKKPNNDNLPDDFDPSPFKDSKDDLNHALEDVKIQEKFSQAAFIQYFGPLLKNFQKFLQAGFLKDNKKFDEIPLIFIKVHTSPEGFQTIPPERSIFISKLNRNNREITLGFAYDWLISNDMIKHPIPLKEVFISNYWKQNFEHLIN